MIPNDVWKENIQGMTSRSPDSSGLAPEMTLEPSQGRLGRTALDARYGLPQDGICVLRRGDLETVDFDIREWREFLLFRKAWSVEARICFQKCSIPHLRLSA